MNARSDSRGHGKQKRIVIIGPGRVGSFWARSALQNGFEVELRARTPDNVPEDLRHIAYPFSSDLLPALWKEHDLVLLTCNDSDIPGVAQQLNSPASLHEQDTGPIVAHVSGRSSTQVLLDAGVPAARAVSAHPLFPFKSRESSPQPEEVFHAVEGTTAATERMTDIIEETGARYFCLNNTNRHLYHLACVVASNHLVTLYHVAQTLLNLASSTGNVPPEALRNLMEASLENLRGEDPDRALSGPAQRGDIAVISDHINALDDLAPDYKPLYFELLRAALPLLPQQNHEKLLQLLNEPRS